MTLVGTSPASVLLGLHGRIALTTIEIRSIAIIVS